MTRRTDRIIEERGKADSLKSDNGPEFTSRHFAWLGVKREALRCITFSPVSRCRTATGKLNDTAGRVSERELVSESDGRKAKDRKLASGIQCRSAAQQPGLPHSGGVRASLL